MSLPPLYCVTLAEEPWKGRLAAAHFKERGIDDVRFVYGVQGVTLGLKPTNPYEHLEDGTPQYLHPAVVGCCLSHRLAIQIALSNGHDSFIICEDDVDLIEGFVEHWQTFERIIPSDADVIQLEHCCSEGKLIEPHGLVARCFPYPFCAACLWWRRDAALEALALMRPIDRPYDIMLMQRVYPFLSHYIATPPLASQRSNHTWPSSIDNAPKSSTTPD